MLSINDICFHRAIFENRNVMLSFDICRVCPVDGQNSRNFQCDHEHQLVKGSEFFDYSDPYEHKCFIWYNFVTHCVM